MLNDNIMSSKLNKYIDNNCSIEESKECIDSICSGRSDVDRSMSSQWREDICSRTDTPLDKIESITRINSEIDRVDKITKSIERNFRERAKRVRFRYISIAAAIAIVSILSITFQYLNRPIYRQESTVATVTVPFGAVTNFTLPDGTAVWLNSGSTIKYRQDLDCNDIRWVSLDGEGYFDVAKDGGKPFQVRGGELIVDVTGTKFAIRSYSDEDNITVSLEEGSVNLIDSISNRSVVSLTPGQVVKFSSDRRTLSKVDSQDVYRHSMWRYGRTIFSDDSLSDVIVRLEKMFNIEITVADSDLYEIPFTAKFTNMDLDRTLRVLSLSTGMSYSIEQGDLSRDKLGVTFSKK